MLPSTLINTEREGSVRGEMREGSGAQQESVRGVMGNHLIPLELEDAGFVPVLRLLDGAGRFLEKAPSVRQLGGEAGQDLPDRWEAAVRAHQLLLQLTDTPQHWKHNEKHEQLLIISVTFE